MFEIKVFASNFPIHTSHFIARPDLPRSPLYVIVTE
jgi:hypothetical protein